MKTGAISPACGLAIKRQQNFLVMMKTQLLACCDAELRRDLHRTDKLIENKMEADIMKVIESLAVKQENIMVFRLTLQNMHQDREEPVRNYAARLHGQAYICKFIVQCPCDPPANVSFMDQMIRNVLIRGIQDQDIQNNILGLEDQEMDLEALLRYVEVREAGRRSQVSLSAEGAHGLSQYKRATHTNAISRKAKCIKCNEEFSRPLSRSGKPHPFRMCKQCFTAQKK